MAEVAELMGLGNKGKAERRRHVRRLLRRLEQRDGTKYVRRFGAGKNSPLYVSVSALEQLMPWDPGTLTSIRADVTQIGTRLKRVERRVEANKKDIAIMKQFNSHSAKLHDLTQQMLGPK